MNEDAWPSRERAPDHAAERAPLPRTEDLPVAENGYDRDAVNAAFDAFYRHTAQLDATLRTLEAVDTFTRQAAELRADLRTLRSGGLGPQGWSSPYSAPASERVGISPAVPRIAIELAFVIAVPVVAGAIGHFDSSIVLAVTLAAWALTALIEFAAYRARISPAVLPRVAPGEPAAVVVEPEPAAEPAGRGELLIEGSDGGQTMIAPGVEPEKAVDQEPVPEPVAEAEPVSVIEPPTPEPTFPAPPSTPIVEPPTPEPSIAPPEPEPTFPPTAPEPTFPPEQPEPEPSEFEPEPSEPEPSEPAEPEPTQPVAESGDSHRRRGLFRRSRTVDLRLDEAEPELSEPAEPEPPQPVAESGDSHRRRGLFRRSRIVDLRLDEVDHEAEPELEPELELAPEPEAIIEETPKRRLFGRRRSEEAEPVLELAAEPEPEPEPAEPEPAEPEPYVDPWERDFEYSAPEELEDVPEPEEAPPGETTQEPLAAERSELELDRGDSNGSPLEDADETSMTTAPRRGEFGPRRRRRR